jgi:hypothetical protein
VVTLSLKRSIIGGSSWALPGAVRYYAA